VRIWQVVVVVMLLGGCEIDTSPPQVVELQTACQMDFRPDTSHRQIVDVTVLEYGTRTPIGDVTVELARNLPLQMTSLTTNDEGLAHFDLPTENWHVSRVVDPDYVTACPPTFEDNDWHHPLVEKRHGRDRDEYTCLLVHSGVDAAYGGSSADGRSHTGRVPMSGASVMPPRRSRCASMNRPPLQYVVPMPHSASAVNHGGRLMAIHESASRSAPPDDFRAKYTKRRPSGETSQRRS
jgi:hypothetical protein